MNSNPTAADFIRIQFNGWVNNTWADFDQIGWNADAYVITTNQYQFPIARGNASGPFDHVQVLALNKANLAAFSNLPLNDGVFNATAAPARMHGAAPGSPSGSLRTAPTRWRRLPTFASSG